MTPPPTGFSRDSASFYASSNGPSNRPFSASSSSNGLSQHKPQFYPQKVNFDLRKSSSPTNSSLYCKYCKRTGHVMEKCHRLHGYPADFKFTKNKRSNDRTAACVQIDTPPSNKSVTPMNSLVLPVLILLHMGSAQSNTNTLCIYSNSHKVHLQTKLALPILQGPSLKRPLEIGRATHGLYLLLSDLLPDSTIVHSISNIPAVPHGTSDLVCNSSSSINPSTVCDESTITCNVSVLPCKNHDVVNKVDLFWY
ncbi:uncharacterized protein LOC132045227 [Lycium ferocissimum]|uniref:uncharacterized protein LOC132045227 n=1 Tax=Lycium ferocissimum TaxID=112874 RepID=UPI002814E64A|nr:uncharacterized protein LOC132045227 [Lycium ferocissimum]